MPVTVPLEDDTSSTARYAAEAGGFAEHVRMHECGSRSPTAPDNRIAYPQ